mmetsp:Transcript_6109/g.13558  ORF Transcript_6109/g.13558 Transcript_6109/m.13558 type:complete len:158 (-) Transcript_6109:112-585(-)
MMTLAHVVIFIAGVAATVSEARIQGEATLAPVSLHSLTSPALRAGQKGDAAQQTDLAEQVETTSTLFIVGWLVSLLSLLGLLLASGKQVLALKVLLAEERLRSQRADSQAREPILGPAASAEQAPSGLATEVDDEQQLEAELGSFFTAMLKEKHSAG